MIQSSYCSPLRAIRQLASINHIYQTLGYQWVNLELNLLNMLVPTMIRDLLASRWMHDPRFVGLTLDALNLEMSKISAMNKDFSNSIMPHCREYKSSDGSLSYLQTNVNPLKTYDSSYFMWGLSCSQVGFQSGTMSSPMSNINFQFDANIMFLLDAEIMIQVVPNSDHPVVRVSTKSVV